MYFGYFTKEAVNNTIDTDKHNRSWKQFYIIYAQ